MAPTSSLAKLGQSVAGFASSSSPPHLKLGQSLTGTGSTYTITRQVGEFVWLARHLYGQIVIIKAARHFRIANERDVLRKYQNRTPHLRPLIDEITGPRTPPAIVLRHLESDLRTASGTKKLSGREIKHVSKRVPEALSVLHEDGYIHTDVKMDNTLVNYAPRSQSTSTQRFTDGQLADLESTVHVTSGFCKDRDEIGTPIWRSPEAQLGLQWGSPTDIWSFGTMAISMIWGDNFCIFKPNVPRGHDEYEIKILAKYHIYFGPFPPSYGERAGEETLAILSLIMKDVPPEKLRPFFAG